MAAIVHELLGHNVSVVCEGNFTADSVVLRDLPPARIVQVHVFAPPATLRERLVTRDAERHPVHYDAEAADEIVARTLAGEWEPLPLGDRLIRVDGTQGLDVDAVTRAILEL
jgi:predicted kinase